MKPQFDPEVFKSLRDLADELDCSPFELFGTLLVYNAEHGPIIAPRSKVKQIVTNGPVTVVIFEDGQKSIVRKAKGERDDREKAVMAAILKRYCKGWQDEVRAVGGEWASL